MKVALTGISGFIGSVIARHLSRAGHSVIGLVRSTSRRDHIDEFADRLVVGDQDDESAWPDLLEGAHCVVHNSVDWSVLREPVDLDVHLRSNLLGSLRLLEASGSRQFVFMSTIAVHHEMRSRWKGRIDEDHPLLPGGLYGAYKAAVEAHLWAARVRRGQHVCALRPCGVYGMDPRIERTIGYPIARSVREGKPFAKLGGGKFVHVEDVAKTVTATIGNPDADGKAYNLADCYARWADWAAIAADIAGVEIEIDTSSPPQPKNVFTKDAARELGVALDRGHEGIRTHLAEVLEVLE